MEKLFTRSEWGYVIYENATGKQFPYAKDSDYNEKDGVFTLKERAGRKGVLTIPDASVVLNEAGDTAYSEATMEAFFRENTGK